MKTFCTPPSIFRALERRRKLIRAARHAFVLWGEASEQFLAASSDLRPVKMIISDAHRLTVHRARRYNVLESLLADESGVSKSEVLHTMHTWTGVCPALCENNL